jgi:hypothetical protein
MRSFIFNFNFGSPKRCSGPAIILFFLTSFAFFSVLGEALCRYLPPDRFWHGEIPTPPLEKNYIVDEAYSDHSDRYGILYYGIGDADDNARKADVLLLGNSRVFFGFRASEVRAFSRSTGISLFNFSSPGGDTVILARKILREKRLKPLILVVNDYNFFRKFLSEFAKETILNGYWNARMGIWEHRLSWCVRCGLYRFFPHFAFGEVKDPAHVVFYESQQDGCLLTENFKPEKYPVIYEKANEDDFFPDELELAREFKEQVNALIVITNVPYGPTSYKHLDQLSKELEVPLIAPVVKGLNTFDGTHLDKESAKKFADEFFKEFLLNRRVRSALAGKP